MNILVTGANGQLGREMQRLGAVSPNNYLFTDVAELDITDPEAVRRCVTGNRIGAIVNCAAYTNVERAEEDEATADRLNRAAVGNLARAAAEADALLVHVSTDYVFDGCASLPYTEEDPTAPRSAYGRTKLAGEETVRASGCRHLILRTAWLYSEYGNNFLKTMLRLTAERETLNVVFDQVGTPTYAGDLALAIFSILEGRPGPRPRGNVSLLGRGRPARGTTSPWRLPALRATTAAASRPAARPTTPPRPYAPPSRCSTRASSNARSASRSPTGGSRCSTV